MKKKEDTCALSRNGLPLNGYKQLQLTSDPLHIADQELSLWFSVQVIIFDKNIF